MNKSIQGDFQICISVPLIPKSGAYVSKVLREVYDILVTNLSIIMINELRFNLLS